MNQHTCPSVERRCGRRRRRAVLAFAAMVAVLGLPASPALAHDSGDAPASNYRAEVVSIDPAPEDVTARVIEAGSRLELTNRGYEEIIVLGYEGEPMLRVGPSGVFENRRSPSIFTSATRPLAVPPDAAATAEPRWQRISDDAVARWHDHRIDLAQGAKAATTSWTVPLRQQDRPITLSGTVRHVPGPNPLPWFGAATLLLAGVAAAAVLRPRGWRLLIAAALAATVVLDAVHSVGRLTASYGPLVNRLFDLFFYPALGWFAAAVGLRKLTSRPGRLPNAAGFAGLILFLIGGLGAAGALSNSQLAFSYAPTLARLAVTAALGVGGGLLVALVSSLFEPLPAQVMEQASASREDLEPGPGAERAATSPSEGFAGQ